MKTVLLVSTNSLNQKIYESGLKKHFRIEFDKGREVDAVVVDIPGAYSAMDLKWLLKLKLPTVVTTSQDSLPLPKRSSRLILTYPVTMAKLLQALARLGVTPDSERPPSLRSEKTT